MKPTKEQMQNELTRMSDCYVDSHFDTAGPLGEIDKHYDRIGAIRALIENGTEVDEKEKTSKYLKFEYPPKSLLNEGAASGLGILVKSKRHGNILGRFEYYLAWQQNVFVPHPGTAWSWDCLEDIIAELKKLNRKKAGMRVKEPE